MTFFTMRTEDRELRRGATRVKIPFLALFMVGVFAAGSGLAQQKSDFAGDYEGVLGPLHVKLHIIVSPDGSLSANVDSPDQGLFALPCSDISINGQTLSLTVPNVHGEWMGTLSADHRSLSGIWKQGAPMPLNFTRIGAAPLGSNPAPSTPAEQPRMPAPAGAGAQHPPCTSMMSMNYWDGSAWKPMTVASHMGGDQGISFKQGLKNPFNPMAGRTNILTFKNAAAALTLEPKPSFCISILPNLDPTEIMIGSLDVKKDHRQLETCTGICASSAKRSMDDWLPEKRVQPVDIKRLSDTVVEITPKNQLPPGQYILGGPGVLVGYYDFGVEQPSAAR